MKPQIGSTLPKSTTKCLIRRPSRNISKRVRKYSLSVKTVSAWTLKKILPLRSPSELYILSISLPFFKNIEFGFSIPNSTSGNQINSLLLRASETPLNVYSLIFASRFLSTDQKFCSLYRDIINI